MKKSIKKDLTKTKLLSILESDKENKTLTGENKMKTLIRKIGDIDPGWIVILFAIALLIGFVVEMLGADLTYGSIETLKGM